MLAVDRRAALVQLGLLPLALGACATQGGPTTQRVTFNQLAPIRFDAAQVEFVDAYRPPMQVPNVEHTFAQTPASAARDWARQRLVAAGPTGTIRVTLQDASVVAVPLPVRRGVGGLFYDEQDTRYDAAIEVTVEAVGGRASGSQARARAVRTRTIPESITLNQRAQVQYELLKALMDDLDEQIVRAVRQYLAPVILG